MTPSIIVAVLVACAAIVGFSWGVVLTYKYMVLPAREQRDQIMQMTIEHLTKEANMLREILGKPSEPVVSPIQQV